MARRTLTESQASGPHALLAKMVGEWQGTARTWFEPGRLGDTSPIRGSVRLVAGGRFALHEYEGTLCGDDMRGVALHGYALGEGRYETAWVDSCHNGTRIMLSLADRDPSDTVASVLGSYPAPPGQPWGWRTEIDVSGPADELEIRHYNLTPAGDEALAVEIKYARVSPDARVSPEA